MDSPLQAFPSEHRDSASEPRQPGPPAPAPTSRRIVGYSRTFSGWTVAWHEAPPPAPREALGALVVTGVVTAVVAAAALAVWLRPPVPSSRVAAATVEATAQPSLERGLARADASAASAVQPIAQAVRTTPADPPARNIVAAPPAAAVRAAPGGPIKAEPARATAPAVRPPAPRKERVAAVRPQPAAAAAAAGANPAGERNGEGGSLVVLTEPDGARVTINGVGYGTTPLTIPYLPPGAKRVRVTKTGYETEERVISADDLGGRTPIRIDLSKAGERTPP